MLAKGEVAEIIVRPDVDIVTIVLHPGAVIKGRRIDHRTFHMNIIDTNKFEEKLRAAEQRLGISAGQGVPIVYERTDTAGRLLTTLIAAAIIISIISRMKFKSPISMDSFVSNHHYFRFG
jgi:spastic paraplegia protein 7